MNSTFHGSYRVLRLKFPVAYVSLMLGLIFASGPPALLAQQDILITRPMENSKRMVSAREFFFLVEASAFEPIREVRINGEVRDIVQESWVLVKKPPATAWRKQIHRGSHNGFRLHLR